MMIDRLKKIIDADVAERKRLIKEFQEEIWNDESKPKNSFFEIFSDLAYDLDYYEPDEKSRSEDASYYGDERLEAEIRHALEKLKAKEI